MRVKGLATMSTPISHTQAPQTSMTTREQEPHSPRTDGIDVSAFNALLGLRLPQKNRKQVEDEETTLVAAVPMKNPPTKSLIEPPSTPLGLATPLQSRI